MSVAPHPHTGLQTVSWLFTGEIEHRDSAGHHAMVRPGEVNLMTAGRGISHSEVSTPATTTLHGAQLWVALPDASRATRPRLRAPRPRAGAPATGWEARVFLGSLLGATSPVADRTPRCSAPSCCSTPAPRSTSTSTPTFEHGVLVDTGVVDVDGDRGQAGRPRLRRRPARTTLALAAGDEPVRLLLLGGPPFGESIVMWWNFVGRTHDEVVGFREEWQAPDHPRRRGRRRQPDVADGRFGVVDDPLPPIPAPPLPNARLERAPLTWRGQPVDR